MYNLKNIDWRGLPSRAKEHISALIQDGGWRAVLSNMRNRWALLIPILLGLLVLLLLLQQKSEPAQGEAEERSQLVRTILVPTTTVVPSAIGHGTVQPGNSWEAVAQVKGKILEKHQKLRKGAMLEADSLLLRIDTTDYELAIARAKADIAALQAQIQELETKAADSHSALKIEEESLALAQKELTRREKLAKKGGLSRSDLESQKRTLLSQQQSVQKQKSSLNLIPTQQALLQAQLARQEAVLSTARRDLTHTVIRIPFTGRISTVNAELEQYVREGEVLLIADDLKLAEVEIQIPINRMAALIRSDKSINLLDIPQQELRKQMGLSAEIHLQEGGINAIWQGRVARFSDSLDPKTRTVGIIIEVDAPYSEVQPGTRPPLLKGMFVEVTLWGKPREERLIIPRSALHSGKVYLVNSENRLELRQVEIELLQPEYAVIATGLATTDRIVVSDLMPAIDGMLLQPTDDTAVVEQLTKAAIRGGIE